MLKVLPASINSTATMFSSLKIKCINELLFCVLHHWQHILEVNLLMNLSSSRTDTSTFQAVRRSISLTHISLKLGFSGIDLESRKCSKLEGETFSVRSFLITLTIYPHKLVGACLILCDRSIRLQSSASIPDGSDPLLSSDLLFTLVWHCRI